MKRPFKQRVRTFVQGIGIDIGAWAFDHLHTCPITPICWRDRLRWLLEGIGDAIFCVAYEGSDEEIDAVAYGEIPLHVMNDRQREELARYDPTSWPFSCCAPSCRWTGNLTETRDDHCPRCGGSVSVYFPQENLKPIALLPEHCASRKAVLA